MPPKKANKAKAPAAAASEGAGFGRPHDVTRRFLRLIRTFAKVLFFDVRTRACGARPCTATYERLAQCNSVLQACSATRKV